MNKLPTDNQLQDMAVPTVELSHHRAQLKHVLLSAARKQLAAKKASTPKGWIRTMTIPKNLITSAGIAGVLALAVVTTMSLSPPSNVSAQELARQTSQAVLALTPQQREAMSADYKKYLPYFEAWLRSAEKAPDLQILSYDEMAKAYLSATSEPLRIIDDPTDDTTEKPDVRQLRFFVFSVRDGDAKMKIVVGVNDKNIPQAALQHTDQDSKPRVGA